MNTYSGKRYPWNHQSTNLLLDLYGSYEVSEIIAAQANFSHFFKAKKLTIFSTNTRK
jgi:hypothetical protein